MKKLTVIYIASLGHSGSTLLDLMLNQHSTIMSVGEVMFYDEWISKHHLCSCGQTLEECQFWSAAATDMTTPLGPVNHPDYAQHSFQLLEGVSRVSGKKVLVDSSKSLERLLQLRSDPRFEIKMIHLVRNGMAVVHSLGKSHSRPGTMNQELTPATSHLKGILRWVRRNKSYERAATGFGQDESLMIRYEDLCSDPENVLRKICDLVDLEFEVQMIKPGLENIHNIGGSRWRFSQGAVELKLDEKWKAELGGGARLLFNLLARKLNHSYGYPS